MLYNTDRYWLIVPADRSKPRVTARPSYGVPAKLKPTERAYRLIIQTPIPPAPSESPDLEILLPEVTPVACIEIVPEPESVPA